MAEDGATAEIVSRFFLNTCQLRRRLNTDVLSVMYFSVFPKASAAEDDEFDDYILLSTGSAAEFYIEPMLSCIGDVDIMLHRSSQLGVPEGHPPPSQLPAEFYGRVIVYEIIDSEFPGYVYLMSSHLLTEITDDGKYNAVQLPRQYVPHGWARAYREKMQGPSLVGVAQRDSYDSFAKPLAMTLTGSIYDSETTLTYDLVLCLRCLSWPPQAADWPTRQKTTAGQTQ